MIAFDVHTMPYTIIPGTAHRAAVHQYLITQARKIGTLTVEANTLLTPASRDHLKIRLQIVADEAKAAGKSGQRLYLRPATPRDPRGWNTFTRECPGIDI